MAATLADFKGWQIMVMDENGRPVSEGGRRRRRRREGSGKEIVSLQRKSDGLILTSGDSIVCRDQQTNSLSIYMIHEIRLNTASNYVELWCLAYLCWYEINAEEYYAQFLPEALESCPQFKTEVERAEYFHEKFQLECNRSELYLTAEVSEIYLKDLVSPAEIYTPGNYPSEMGTQENQTHMFVVSSACEPDGNKFVPIDIREVEEKVRKWDPESSKKYLKELTANIGGNLKKRTTPFTGPKKKSGKPKKGPATLKRVVVKNESASSVSNEEQPSFKESGLNVVPKQEPVLEIVLKPTKSNKETVSGRADSKLVEKPNQNSGNPLKSKDKRWTKASDGLDKENGLPSKNIGKSVDEFAPSKRPNNKKAPVTRTRTTEKTAARGYKGNVTHSGDDEYDWDSTSDSSSPGLTDEEFLIKARDAESENYEISSADELALTNEENIDFERLERSMENETEYQNSTFPKRSRRTNTEVGHRKRKLSSSPTKEVVPSTPKKSAIKKNVARAKKAYTPFSKLYRRPQDIPDLNKNGEFYRESHDWDISALENQFRSPTKNKTVETIFSKVKRQLNSTHGKEEIVKASNFEDYLPARENEFATIYLSMYSAIEAGTGTSIYIAGTPGVGKTLTVREVVKELLISADRKELPQFQYIEINGLKMVKPTDSYEVLWKKISGSTLTSGAAMESLEYYFKEIPQSKKRPVVVLLDELDALVTKTQDVMYNFFNWTTYENSKFVVVAVANTMDLPERQLGNKVSSRIGFTRIMFTGYTHDELKTIINLRLMGLNDSYFYVDPTSGSSYLCQDGNMDELPKDISKLQRVRLKISEDAVEIASRKIASVSGDARRALKVCKRAVEIAEHEYMQNHGYGYDGKLIKDRKKSTKQKDGSKEELQKVEIYHITKALHDAINSPTDTFMSKLSFTSKLFLYSLVNLIRKSGSQEQTLGDIIDEIRLLLEVNGKNKYILEMKRVLFLSNGAEEDEEEQLRIISWDYVINQLVETSLIIKQNLKNERMCAIKLNISFEEVCKNIMEDEMLKTL
ncbi:origin recognition complex subunit 1 Ecym_1154 [Eremothecium cymbalariae DBVPG|uniref:Origin recognition complex subunit 1 n=1 Tax=Eremothecium cymbalariae (strain CBS 270.75 / DBVPG 7215 / KCTC 17166 / NRRL Y-17582) TaxID=931890 RepID=G8JMQ0_ERECY|nr:hypothetical protein Ecym_1154 [Eremothecium cymbalariae DBVPG\